MHPKDMMLKALQESPIIASLHKPELVPVVIASNARIIMVSSGDIFNIVEICNVLRKKNKIVLVHIDLVAGMSRDKTAVRYLKEKAGIHGIVSSNSQLIPYVKKEGLVTAQRLFAIDTPSITSGLTCLRNSKADFIEVMPGLAVTEVYDTIRGYFEQPIIAAGLIKRQKDVERALKAGAIGVDTSNQKLWNYSKSITSETT